MDAALVFDGDDVRIPKTMGTPLSDQMQGTVAEQLGELASRICYDSLGEDLETGKRRGRSSSALHAHILEVQNHSVYEHFNFTVRIFTRGRYSIPEVVFPLLNRKGIWIEVPVNDEHGTVDITTNFRAILEWERWTKVVNLTSATSIVRTILQSHAARLAPMIFPIPQMSNELVEASRVLEPKYLNPYQSWISLWLYGSRGFTHEQVRHRFAMSQRSTRYVDESVSEYIEHPLVARYLKESPKANAARFQIQASITSDRATYRYLVECLTDYCKSTMGLEGTQARKQARGAARGYLGNALASEMIYSAPIAGWQWILSQRKNKLADAEIRQIYSPALQALKTSRYREHFTMFEEVPSPDGIGTVLQ